MGGFLLYVLFIVVIALEWRTLTDRRYDTIQAERAAIGIDDGLVRLSVGIEDVEDLERDVWEALEGVRTGVTRAGSLRPSGGPLASHTFQLGAAPSSRRKARVHPFGTLA